MALSFEKVEFEKKDFGRLEDGTHAARLVRIIDLGEQEDTMYPLDRSGNPKKPQQKYWLEFEFPTETIEIDDEERPRWLGKEFWHYQVGKVVDALDPTGKLSDNGKNVPALLGADCMVKIGTTSGGKAKIVDVLKTLKGFSVPPLANPTVLFDMDAPDPEAWESIQDFLKNKVREAKNYVGSPVAELDQTGGDGFNPED